MFSYAIRNVETGDLGNLSFFLAQLSPLTLCQTRTEALILREKKCGQRKFNLEFEPTQQLHSPFDVNMDPSKTRLKRK